MLEFFAPILGSVLLIMVCVWIYADVEAGGDKYGISLEYDLSHLWNARERGVAIGMASVSFHARALVDSFGWPPLPLLVELLKCLVLALLLAVLFWIAFDVRLNIRRAKGWNYLGSSAKLDWMAHQLFRGQHPGTAFLLTKIVFFSLLFLFYLGAVWLRRTV